MIRQLSKRFSSNPEKRRKARWDAINTEASRNGFEMYKSHLNWLADPAFVAAKEQWGDVPGNSADRSFFLFSTAQSLKTVPGDTVDIGVRYGSSSFYILKAMNDASRQHHLFDSFEGLSAPTEQDRNEKSQKIFWRKGDIKVEEEVTRQYLSMFPNCHYHKGWIPARFPDVADRKFALVHLDVDLYQPSVDSLEFFWERVSPGGVVICDDYGLSTCPGAKKAMDEFFAGKEPVFQIPSGQAMVIKR